MKSAARRWPLTIRFGLITLICLVVPVGILLTYLNLSIGASFRGSVAESMALRQGFLRSWFAEEDQATRRLHDYILREAEAGRVAGIGWWGRLAESSGTTFMVRRDGQPPLVLGLARDSDRLLVDDVERWWQRQVWTGVLTAHNQVWRVSSVGLPLAQDGSAASSGKPLGTLVALRRLDFPYLPWMTDERGSGLTVVDLATREPVFSSFNDQLARRMADTWLASVGRVGTESVSQAAEWLGRGYNSLGFIVSVEPQFRLLVIIAVPDRLNAAADITLPIVMVALLISLMIALFALVMTRVVIGPILSLSYAVESIRLHLRQHGPLVSIPVRRNDEIGDLARAINELGQELGSSVEKIAEQRSEIIAYTHSLEERVQERTRELDDARMRAEIANQHKSKFLVNMNHELRTPLNAISGITDLLRYGAYEKHLEVAGVLDRVKAIMAGDSRTPPDFLHSLELAATRLPEDGDGKRTILEVLRDRLRVIDLPAAREGLALIDEGFGFVDEEERQTLKAYNTIHEAGVTLLGIIDEVINLSRIESGQIVIEPMPVRVADLVGTCMAHAEAYARYHGKFDDFVLSREIDPAVPEVVWLDSQKVKQVLLNLLTNAVKYTERGQVRLKVSVQDGGPRPMVRCSVSDTGRGIADKDRPLIFMEFGRSFEVREIEGTGLGLALSRKLILRHGGDMGFTSEPGRGSTFWFTLPLDSGPAKENPS